MVVFLSSFSVGGFSGSDVAEEAALGEEAEDGEREREQNGRLHGGVLQLTG